MISTVMPSPPTPANRLLLLPYPTVVSPASTAMSRPPPPNLLLSPSGTDPLTRRRRLLLRLWWGGLRGRGRVGAGIALERDGRVVEFSLQVGIRSKESRSFNLLLGSHIDATNKAKHTKSYY